MWRGVVDWCVLCGGGGGGWRGFVWCGVMCVYVWCVVCGVCRCRCKISMCVPTYTYKYMIQVGVYKMHKFIHRSTNI